MSFDVYFLFFKKEKSKVKRATIKVDKHRGTAAVAAIWIFQIHFSPLPEFLFFLSPAPNWNLIVGYGWDDAESQDTWSNSIQFPISNSERDGFGCLLGRDWTRKLKENWKSILSNFSSYFHKQIESEREKKLRKKKSCHVKRKKIKSKSKLSFSNFLLSVVRPFAILIYFRALEQLGKRSNWVVSFFVDLFNSRLLFRRTSNHFTIVSNTTTLLKVESSSNFNSKSFSNAKKNKPKEKRLLFDDYLICHSNSSSRKPPPIAHAAVDDDMRIELKNSFFIFDFSIFSR